MFMLKNKAILESQRSERKHFSMFLTYSCLLHSFQLTPHSLTVDTENAFPTIERSPMRASICVLLLELDFMKCTFS